MKAFRLMLVVTAAALITLGLSGTAAAFHSGGVAECVGCHSMHAPNGSFLLNAADASSTCLDCHENSTGGSYHISTAETAMPAGSPPLNKTPGGDFGWLKKDYNWNPGWAPQSEDGNTHGHNIIASDYNYVVDPNHTEAPGGTFASGNLACVSCHNPHGTYRRLGDGTVSTTGDAIKGSGSYNNSDDPVTGSYAVGVYRLLGGDNYEPQAGITFDGVPAAVVPSSYNRSESATQTRTAYGVSTAGGHEKWGDWCATCHGDMHSSGPAIVHPTDENLGSTIAGLYDQYRGSGDLTGTNTDSFLSLVPFMEETGDYTTLKAHAQNDDTVLTGPASNDDVSCLSCHRAHASGFKHGLRWNPEIELIVVNGFWPGTDSADAEASAAKWAMGRTVAEMEAAYGGYAASNFGTYQRSLCNKCHAKD